MDKVKRVCIVKNQEGRLAEDGAKETCSVAQSCPTLWDPMDCSTPGFPVLHHLLELAQTHVHWISHTIQPSQPSLQFSSVAQPCPTLFDPMNCSTPGLPVHHQLLEFAKTHVHRVSDAIQPSHPLLSPSPPALNPSQHQSLFQWVNSSHEVAKVLEFQL